MMNICFLPGHAVLHQSSWQRFNNYRLDMNEKELNAKTHRERSERLCYTTHCVSEGSGELSNGMLYFEVV